jgi:hypothetical protein
VWLMGAGKTSAGGRWIEEMLSCDCVGLAGLQGLLK